MAKGEAPFIPGDGAIPGVPEPCRKLSLTTQPSGGSSSARLRRQRHAGHARLRDFRQDRARPVVQLPPTRPDKTDDRRQTAPSPLEKIQPEGWLAEYTEDLLNLLNVLGRLVALEPRQAELLNRIVAGPLVAIADSEPQSGTTDDEPSQ